MMSDREIEIRLLKEILAVLEERAVGHIIMYSDRVTPFIPRIRECLNSERKISENNPLLLSEDGVASFT
jgi:hypothetical protein